MKNPHFERFYNLTKNRIEDIFEKLDDNLKEEFINTLLYGVEESIYKFGIQVRTYKDKKHI